MLRSAIKYILITSLLFYAISADATVIITKNNGRVLIGGEVYVLKNCQGLGFNAIRRSTGFVRQTADVPNLGFSKGNVWLRFTVTNKSDNAGLLLDVDYPMLDEVELFSPDKNGNYHSRLMGGVKPFKERIYNHPDYIFDLYIPKNTSSDYYLRIKSTEQLILPISVNRGDCLWQFLNEESLLTGLFIGAIFIMFLYNLFLFFSIKDPSYLYYVVYVASVGFTQAGIKGYTFKYLWPNSPEFELRGIIYFACVAAIAASLFTKKFLSTSVRASRCDKVLTAIISLLCIAFLLTAAGDIHLGFALMQIATTLFVFSQVIVSAIVLKGGYRPARFTLLSWSVLLLGAVIFALKDNGIIPYTMFTSYAMQGSTVIEMALLSFGLADRFNALKREKEVSQAGALIIAQENERIIREQNNLLEEKVTERTRKLNRSLDDLKQAQSQLVEAEKMASLGQLTAGIAHEINNPINFVTANINPLKRDIETVIDTMNRIENIALSDASTEEKQKIVSSLKEAVELDYLLVEIHQLMSGISEGASRTTEIVKGLRLFSRLDEDDLKLADINEGLEATLTIANNLLNNRIKVIKDFDKLPLIECYAGKLNQVFLNIISNAAYAVDRKFESKPGGEIKISTQLSGDKVIITVGDNGIGMNEDTIRKVFEPFFTTKGVGEGTGLGMSIAYNTIKKHNGQISVTSEPGAGSDFTLKIPVTFASAPSSA